MNMNKIIVSVVFLFACGGPENITPDPSTSGNGGSTSVSSQSSSISGTGGAGGDSSASSSVAMGAGGSVVFDAVTEPCDKSFTINNATYLFAEHQYPGASRAELAFIHAVGELAVDAVIPPGYQTAAIVHPKDGAVSVVCGNQTAPFLTSVTFIEMVFQ